MSDLDVALAGARTAVTQLLAAADKAAAAWTVPRAPGKWSPSQTVEHVARIMDEQANVASDAPSKFPNLPFFLRPIVRRIFFKRSLERNAFPAKSKTIKAMDPTAGSATPAEARVRLDAVFARFEQACRVRAATGKKVRSSLFGSVQVDDFARFQELHVRHHLQQLTQ
jgi:hypothetical protein